MASYNTQKMQRRLIFGTIGLAALVMIDRLLKMLALHGVTASWWIAEFQLFRNYNLVFSWPLSNTVAIIGMSVAMLVVLLLGWNWWRKMNYQAAFGAMMMFLGAISNFFDRLHFGFVIDWGYFGRWWPIFNLADVMIFSGVLIILLSSRLDKKIS